MVLTADFAKMKTDKRLMFRAFANDYSFTTDMDVADDACGFAAALLAVTAAACQQLRRYGLCAVFRSDAMTKLVGEYAERIEPVTRPQFGARCV